MTTPGPQPSYRTLDPSQASAPRASRTGRCHRGDPRGSSSSVRITKVRGSWAFLPLAQITDKPLPHKLGQSPDPQSQIPHEVRMTGTHQSSRRITGTLSSFSTVRWRAARPTHRKPGFPRLTTTSEHSQAQADGALVLPPAANSGLAPHHSSAPAQTWTQPQGTAAH